MQICVADFIGITYNWCLPHVCHCRLSFKIVINKSLNLPIVVSQINQVDAAAVPFQHSHILYSKLPNRWNNASNQHSLLCIYLPLNLCMIAHRLKTLDNIFKCSIMMYILRTVYFISNYFSKFRFYLRFYNII